MPQVTAATKIKTLIARINTAHRDVCGNALTTLEYAAGRKRH